MTIGEHKNGLYHDPFIGQIMTQMNRIESKVDTMQEAFVQMARTEERVVRLLEADTKKTEWMLQLQNRIVDVEKIDIAHTAVSSRIERVVWIFITAALTMLVGWYITAGKM